MNLEELIKHGDKVPTKKIISEDEVRSSAALPQKADKSANLSEFFNLVGKVVEKTMGKHNVEYMPDDRKQVIRDQSAKIDKSYITYKTKRRKPKDGFKPRVREDFLESSDDNNDNRQGKIWGQHFECVVQFNIYATTYEEGQKILDKFEENMYRYTYFFKREGIQEMYFQQEIEDENYQVFRENISVRNVQYTVIIEKLIVEFNSEFDHISIK